METAFFVFLFGLYGLQLVPTAASRIRITDNGYEDILVSLPVSTPVQDRPGLITSLKDLLQESSSLLNEGTKGRAYFRNIVFLIPPQWGDIDSWYPMAKNTSFEEAGAAFYRRAADVEVAHTTQDDHPYTLHQGGCGRRALRIYVPSSFLSSGTRENRNKIFINLWSEFRYGIFIEDGFEGDEKFPLTYNIPGDSQNRTTGCNLDFFRSPNQWNSEGTVYFSGIQQGENYTPKTDLFCEGHLTLGRNHNPEAPSKHNLLCNEQGTWFVVRRNADFRKGRNAAKLESTPEVKFRFVREVPAPKVVVAIEVSSKMHKDRYALVQNAFSHFVTTALPDGCELTLITFGGSEGLSVITSSEMLEDEASRIGYLEGQPLPEEPSNEDNVCLDCVISDIIEMVSNENTTFTSAPEIVIVTTQSEYDSAREQELHQAIEQSEIRLHVFSFLDDHPERSYQVSSIYELCLATRSKFVSLKDDALGNLYRAFDDVVTGSKSRVMIAQEYLSTRDDENILLKFTVDGSLTDNLKISLSGATFKIPPLIYDSTTLTSPSGYMIHPKKQELVPSWIFDVRNLEVGEYVLETRRKEDAKSSVIVTITSSTQDDPITTNVWVEILESKVAPPPVQIFAEVKQGPNPVRNATVVAYVYHPGTDGTSEILLLDDGLGNVDITKDDGIYSCFYTNFTSTGFYSVYVKVTGGSDNTEVLNGSTSACCGSAFPYRDQRSTGPFQREAGPAIFQVKVISNEDIYPPSKVMDLHVFQNYSQVVVLHWTAVGDDFNAGVAPFYELKLFPDRFTLRNRFSDSGLEVFSEKIDTTPHATYGTSLFHMLQLPEVVHQGVYYFGIRAVDKAGNVGEPSNAVPVRLEQKKSEITCSSDNE